MTLLTNPVNVCLIPPILYVIYLIIFPTPSRPTTTPHLYSEEHYNWMPNKHPDVACYKKYTAHELKPYNGLNEKDKDGGRILLAIMRTGHKGEKLERTVFDVTAGRTFYGPDGMYGNFAGRDASRGMAKQSFDEDMLTDVNKPLDDLSDLTSSEIENMAGWHGHFAAKYTVVGELIES